MVFFKYEDKQFSTVPSRQAWNISKINNRYLIGHNEGTFVYENDVFKIKYSRNGAGTTKSSINNSYLQASYSGISIYPLKVIYLKS
jgi:hypothetical protein